MKIPQITTQDVQNRRPHDMTEGCRTVPKTTAHNLDIVSVKTENMGKSISTLAHEMTRHGDSSHGHTHQAAKQCWIARFVHTLAPQHAQWHRRSDSGVQRMAYEGQLAVDQTVQMRISLHMNISSRAIDLQLHTWKAAQVTRIQTADALGCSLT